MGQSRRLSKLGAYLRPHWREAGLGIVALFTVNGLGVYIPQLIRNCVDRLSSSNFTDGELWEFVLPIISLTAAMWLIRMASRIWLFGVGRQVEFDLKQKIFQHLLSMEPAYFATNTSGDLISRATSDVDNIRRLLGFAVLSLANTIFAYALTLPYMLAINATITVASLAVYPVMFLLVHLFSDRLRNEQATVQGRISELSELIQEDVSGIALIKIYAQEENERRAFTRKNQALLNANIQLAKSRNTLFPLIGGLASISSLIVIWLGAGRIAENSLTVGDFIALLLYVERLVFPTALLGFTITAFQRGEVSIDRIEAILSTQPKIYDFAPTQPLPQNQVMGKLEAKHLNYQYPGSKEPALADINFRIEPGETIAIVGAIGSGKSTLANSLTRLIDIQPGQLFLDGIDITKISLTDLRSAIAYVPQDSFLFSTSIKNNIRFGKPLCDIYTVEDAAKIAQIHPEILNFPQKYDTIVGERGITLSGGQRQRTALARALVVDAPILILDDALSSVDNQTATAILNNLSQGTQRKTVLFITHQLSAAATADRIFVMENGKIVQTGTHNELIQQPGLYQSLWNQNHVEELLH
ncbi:ABC transporter ATP-binding protein [Calothrix sp. NIES-3974]|uniref:ABC transporter ATP-binding protein n=1 Tax=Calothrix sp. NIES-3974 TaxID=2005462 RepID=UPI000B618058|nr:ABC transporter ATP-binding protein [Calothrix sp. NIES-3974]BAZ07730.1 ABC transporter-related protein [Calothrix sp. NIES-3974]